MISIKDKKRKKMKVLVTVLEMIQIIKNADFDENLSLLLPTTES